VWDQNVAIHNEIQNAFAPGDVPGVMMPYWDWTDPASIMTGTFLGPNGSGGSSTVSAGYFAPTAPGTGRRWA
jgi:hypothetical protein